ncbi:hypothetical protein Q31b_12590 [Novipirellula aureliae]|uniref:Tim44-like domain protein n=1 Tax=Novipirellula aureliae TaxID=2527966 RepID=A0A5C6E4H4_9BACT|nr:hypothetical protein [Novipirellula aureliae]TWU43730.1 hypothetical protein Q31b_12590 [Novipirellula aureliae]
MNMIAEQPLIVSIFLGFVSLALLFGWLQTGNKAAGIAGLIFLLLIPAEWFVAANIVTDREQIETLIYETADAVENERYEDAYKVIGDPDAERRARIELPPYTFDIARVNSIRSIKVIEGMQPLEAEVDMTIKADISNRSGTINDFRVVRRLVLRLQKDPKGQNTTGQWKVIDYQNLPMTGGPDQFSTLPQ